MEFLALFHNFGKRRWIVTIVLFSYVLTLFVTRFVVQYEILGVRNKLNSEEAANEPFDTHVAATMFRLFSAIYGHKFGLKIMGSLWLLLPMKIVWYICEMYLSFLIICNTPLCDDKTCCMVAYRSIPDVLGLSRRPCHDTCRHDKR